MAFITKFDGRTDKTIQLGDKNNPVPVSIEGYYLGSKDTPDTGYGPGKLHIFQTEEGTIGVWGKTNSNRLMTPEHRGQMCILTFVGMGKKVKGKNQAYDYSLQYDPTNTINTDGIDVNASEPEQDDGADEASLDADETALDEPVYVAPVAPPKPAAAKVTPDQRARVAALMKAKVGAPKAV